MANPVGRPKSDIETKVIAIRIPVDLFNRLTRHVDLTTSRSQGAKASMNSVANYALEYFLKAQDNGRERTQKEPQRPSTPAPKTATHASVKKPKILSTRRRRILDLLRQHPEGLSHPEIKEKLNLEKDLGDTLHGMLQTGKICNIRKGIYIAADETKKS